MKRYFGTMIVVATISTFILFCFCGCISKAQHKRELVLQEQILMDSYCEALIRTKIRCAVAMKSNQISIPSECSTVWEKMLQSQRVPK